MVMRKYNLKFLFVFIFVAIFQANIALAGSVKGEVKSRRLRNKSNAVVCLAPKGNLETKLPPINPMIDQRKLEFIPHVLPVALGTTVDFLNNDKTKHNIFTPDDVGDKFDFGYYLPGEVKAKTFTKPGSAALLCNKHEEMEAYIFVCESHLFAMTDRKGFYEIKDVPSGDYKLKLWHKKLRPYKQDISVSEAGLDLDVTVKK